MGTPFQTTFHAFMVAWYLMIDIRLLLTGATVLLTRWDILWGQFGWGIQYFTMWNLVIQQGYFILSLKEDLQSNEEKRKNNHASFLNFIFCTLVFPMTFIVSLDFWILYKWDEKLVDSFDAVNTLLPYLNHCLHTTIVPIIIAESVISQKYFTDIKLSDAYKVLIGVHLIYGCVIYSCHYLGNVWPYPFLGYLSLDGQFILSNINAILGLLFVSVAKSAGSISWSLRTIKTHS